MKVSSFEQRVDWLRSHAADWFDWYQETTNKHTEPFDRFTAIHFHSRRRWLFLRMRAEGLFSKRTHWTDVKLSSEMELVYKETKCKLV